MKELLFSNDIETLRDLKSKHVRTESLEQLFNRINRNQRFKEDEKEYLKRILVENINNAFKKSHG